MTNSRSDGVSACIFNMGNQNRHLVTFYEDEILPFCLESQNILDEAEIAESRNL